MGYPLNTYYGQKYGKRACIAVDLAFGESRPPEGHEALHRARVKMREPGPWGFGTGKEFCVLNPAEADVTEHAVELGLIRIGHIRYGGIWELALAGPHGRDDQLRSVLGEVFDYHARAFTMEYVPDDNWRYYHETLYPNPTQLRWIRDYNILTRLELQGDTLEDRIVDHLLTFYRRDNREAFERDARALGFDCTLSDDATYNLQASRKDRLRLQPIHEVVMQLTELAERHGGTYVTWETALVTAD